MENKQKYIIITPYFPCSETHMGSYVYDQSKTISNSEKYEVYIIKVTSYFSLEKDYNFKGIQVKIFKVFDFPFFIFPGIFNWLNSIRIRKFFHTQKLMKNLSVIHAHVCYPSAYLANAIESIVKVKTIVQHHGIDALQLLNGRFSLFTKIQNSFLRNRSIEQLNKIGLSVSVSKRVKKALHGYKKYQPKDEYILYNGVDRTKFYNRNTSRDNEKYTIGCVANFWESKDHISLIKAVKLLVEDGFDCKLRLIGSGPTYFDCFNFVLKHNLHNIITFEKEIKHEQLNHFYNEIDLFVMPSYYEAFGCVYMEAWASNTPFIAIQGQGISEVIPEEKRSVFLTEKQNPIVLKKKILGEYNRKRKYPFNEKYDIKNTISEFLSYTFFKRNG